MNFDPGTLLICRVSLAPLRNQPSHSSEQVSQILFGESCYLISKKDSWALVSCAWDSYQGWITAASLIVHSDSNSPDFTKKAQIVTSDLAIVKDLLSKSRLILSLGSILHPFLFTQGYQILSGTTAPYPRKSVTSDWISLETLGKLWLGAPYLWGGRHRLGVDCSGLMQVLWASQGLNLPRDAKDQYALAPIRVPLFGLDSPKIKPKMMVFAGSEKDNDSITHVGLIINEFQILHASGHVRLDSIDQVGILNENPNLGYTHFFKGMASYLDFDISAKW